MNPEIELHQYISQRLSRFPILNKTLGASWIQKQLRKDKKGWSLITGWLASPEEKIFTSWLIALEGSLAVIQPKVSSDLWRKICGKLREHSNRANTKGTLAEISLCVFLTQHGIQFDMEKRLIPDKKLDVDFKFSDTSGVELNIEMHWLDESDSDKSMNKISADWGGLPYEPSFDAMIKRIQNKLLEKSVKFTKSDITIIAFNCTDDPILGGEYSLFEEAFEAAINNNRSEDYNRIDAVIWFEFEPTSILKPIKRGAIINRNSPLGIIVSRADFYRIWVSS